MARRPSIVAEGVGSASKVARSKNWRSADCSRLSYKAPTGLASIISSEEFSVLNAECRQGKNHNLPVRRETLVDFFADLVTIRGDFLVYDDGYKRRVHSYAEVGRAARGFAARLSAAGIRQGDR